MSTVTVEVNGCLIEADAGETVAVVLRRSGMRFGGTFSGRGLFCGMGSCFECHAEIDGRPFTRTCMTTVRDGMCIRTGEDEVAAP